MFSRSVSAVAAKKPNSSLPGPVGVVNAGQRPGEHLQHQAVLGQMVREGGELCSVPSEPLHLEHGEDDPAVRGMRLDLSGGPQCLLELGVDLDPGADPLAENLVPADAVPDVRSSGASSDTQPERSPTWSDRLPRVIGAFVASRTRAHPLFTVSTFPWMDL
jgi:hypothetical protein